MALPKPRDPDLANSAVLEAIYQRRAARNYTKQSVGKEAVEFLLDAAVQAPSAMNRQPWGFIVIQDRALLTRISDLAKKRFLGDTSRFGGLDEKHIMLEDPNFDIFHGAGTVIVICRHDEEGFCPEGDCYLAGQNLMLAAHAMGLATCPIGFARDVLQTQSLRQELAIPADYWPSLPIAVGYSTAKSDPPEREPIKIFAWR